MGTIIDLKNKKFGRLTVIERAGNDGYGSVMWRCRCDCGTEVTVSSPSLRSGNTRSCGCLHKELTKQAKTTHGLTKTPIHRCWQSMLNRCGNPRSRSYKNYGGRGINVANQWLDFSSFYSDVGDKPGPGYSLDRIDNNLGYFPGNVAWRTWKQQARNRRNNRFIEWNGEKRTVTEWAETVGLAKHVLFQRLTTLGWSVDKVLTTPCRKIRAN